MDSAKVPVKLVKVTRVLGRTGTFLSTKGIKGMDSREGTGKGREREKQHFDTAEKDIEKRCEKWRNGRFYTITTVSH